jgi:poly-gamma-glutamate capsule biosynthesis protein CapA/YwtB (metallophosphatase superfamily)
VRRRRATALGLVVTAAAVGVAFAMRSGGGGPDASAVAATTSVATQPAAPAPVAARPPKTVRITVVGDTVMGTPEYGLPPDGGATFFSAVKPLLTGDVVLGNLEGTLTTTDGSKCGTGSPNCFAFRTPPSYARWLRRAGFTVMNLANNHADDFGAAGERQTVAALDAVGVRHTGRPGEVAHQTVRGVRVGLVGFAPYPWANSLTDLAEVRRRVRAVRPGADIVVVMAHAGAEGSGATHVRPGTEFFLGENRGDPEAFARTAVAAGADLVVMSGPHVLRGMAFRSGHLIAYSLGNFGGYKVFGLNSTTATSGVLQVTLRSDGRFVRARLRPTVLTGAGVPAPGGDGPSLVAQLSREDFGAAAARIDAAGNIRLPAGAAQASG